MTEILKAKTVGELLVALTENTKCEIVAYREEITSIQLKTWLNFDTFKTYPSKTKGWVVYESTLKKD